MIIHACMCVLYCFPLSMPVCEWLYLCACVCVCVSVFQGICLSGVSVSSALSCVECSPHIMTMWAFKAVKLVGLTPEFRTLDQGEHAGTQETEETQLQSSNLPSPTCQQLLLIFSIILSLSRCLSLSMAVSLTFPLFLDYAPSFTQFNSIQGLYWHGKRVNIAKASEVDNI